MIRNAKLHEQELKKMFHIISFDPAYKFMNGVPYTDEFTVDETTMNQHSFVSIWKGEIVGFIRYYIDRITNNVSGLYCVHFGKKHSILFMRDLLSVVSGIFKNFGFYKINFTVIVGNPIEKAYDKLIARYGGRIVGVYKHDARLIDGKFYDLKMYELLASDYWQAKKRVAENGKPIDYPPKGEKHEIDPDKELAAANIMRDYGFISREEYRKIYLECLKRKEAKNGV